MIKQGGIHLKYPIQASVRRGTVNSSMAPCDSAGGPSSI